MKYKYLIILLAITIIVLVQHNKNIHAEKQIALATHEIERLQAQIDALFPECMIEGEFIATAYEPSRKSCGKWAKYKRTKTGTEPSFLRTVAVDPHIIPLGSILHIKGIGWFVAEDTGKAIKGRKIDIYFDNTKDAEIFGIKKVKVFHYDPICFKKRVLYAGVNATYVQ